jgi:hypothetical protein
VPSPAQNGKKQGAPCRVICVGVEEPSLRVKIARSPDALDTLAAVFERSELPPQIAHVRVNPAVIWRKVSPQDASHEFLPANGASRRTQEGREQVEFHRRQTQQSGGDSIRNP